MRVFAIAFILAALSLPAAAQLRMTDLPDVQAAENYLNSITTVQADFIQTAPDGSQAGGIFSLKRPGRMRFEYKHPNRDFIVSDGTLIYFYDAELKEQKNMPVSQSLADFFLRRDIKLSGDVKVTDVRRDGGLVYITVVESKDPTGGSLTVALAQNPMQLKKWRVVDAQGLVTEVELHNPKTGLALDGDLFRYYDPELKKSRYN